MSVAVNPMAVEAPLLAYTPKGMVQACGAKRKNGEPCKLAAMANGRCRLHGGLTPRGIENPNYKTGRYSKHGPLALRARVAEAAESPDLLNTSDSIALLDARIGELMDRLPDDEEQRLAARSMLAHLSEARTQHQRASTSKLSEEDRAGAMKAFFTALEGAWLYQREVAEAAVLAADTWEEIYKVSEVRRRQVDTEVTRIKAAAETLAEDRARVMFGHILHVIRANIKDSATLKRIAEAVRELDSGGAR